MLKRIVNNVFKEKKTKALFFLISDDTKIVLPQMINDFTKLEQFQDLANQMAAIIDDQSNLFYEVYKHTF
jgi:hypothetical protein